MKILTEFTFPNAVRNNVVGVDLPFDCRCLKRDSMQCRDLGCIRDSFLGRLSNFPSIISGFWVGPDAEDGWGFVEALVDHYFE